MCIVWMTYIGDNNTQLDITIALLSANIIYVLSNKMTLNNQEIDAVCELKLKKVDSIVDTIRPLITED